MRAEARANQAQQEQINQGTIDVSLRAAPEPAMRSVPVDQIMLAVDGVRRYVVSHLSRIGRACDVDDVMQDIRVAVWDGVMRGHYRQLLGIPFGAWVQGVCANVCAAHIRREMTHQTLPLLLDPEADRCPSLDAVTLLGLDRGADRSAEKFVDQQWARTIIELPGRACPAECGNLPWTVSPGRGGTARRRRRTVGGGTRRRWSARRRGLFKARWRLTMPASGTSGTSASMQQSACLRRFSAARRQ